VRTVLKDHEAEPATPIGRAQSAQKGDARLAPMKVALAAHCDRLARNPSVQDIADVLGDLISQKRDILPFPGSGQTLLRWESLASVAALSLPLVKLFEGHTDALAICAELGASRLCQGGSWGVWAAESKLQTLSFRGRANEVILDGVKPWCSGASVLSNALVTARSPEGQSFLVAVSLDPRFVRIDIDNWVAVGMRATQTAEVTFTNCPGTLVGGPDDYIARPGFWQGAIGVAACWFGAGLEMAKMLATKLSAKADPHALAHLGGVVATLAASRAAFQQAAMAIDNAPSQSCQGIALMVRASAEASATEVLGRVGRALGAAPYCLDGHFAAIASDLPVFMRQSHAERDLAQLGQLALDQDLLWKL